MPKRCHGSLQLCRPRAGRIIAEIQIHDLELYRLKLKVLCPSPLPQATGGSSVGGFLWKWKIQLSSVQYVPRLCQDCVHGRAL